MSHKKIRNSLLFNILLKTKTGICLAAVFVFLIILFGGAYISADDSTPSVTVPGEGTVNVPSSLSLSEAALKITASWSSNGNPDGTSYYVENTTIGTNSGWLTEITWTTPELSCGTTYSFRVKAKSSDGATESDFSDPVSIKTTLCGGGTWSPNVPPAPAPSEPKVLINNGEQYTEDRNVQLSFTAGPEITIIIISNTKDFAGRVQEIPFVNSYAYDLCFGQDSCPEGKRTIYVKFLNKYRGVMGIIDASIIIREKPTFIEQVKEVSGKITSQIIQGLINRVNDFAKQAKELADKIRKQTTNVLSPPPAPEPETKEAPKIPKTMGFQYSGEPINWWQAIFGTVITAAIIIILILLLVAVILYVYFRKRN